MRGWLAMLFACVGVWAQNSSAPSSSSPNPQNPTAPSSAASKPTAPNLEPPRSDKVDASALDNGPGESSSKDDAPVDLNPPPGDDTKSHSSNSDLLTDMDADSSSDVKEFHPFDPHKAAKNVEVGDYYFKRKNYRAAESRYREALFYKDNDAIATFRLAECLEKTDRPEEARLAYESYLKILPHGPEAEKAQKAKERLRPPSAEAKPQK